MSAQPPTNNDSKPLPPAIRAITSSAIFQGAKEVLIDHHGELYRLRRTRNGKLILQK